MTSSVKVWIVVVAIASDLALSQSVSVATLRTTTPGIPYSAYMVVTDTQLFFDNFLDRGSLPRGAILSFFVHNEGTKPARISVRGKATKVIMPRKWGATPYIVFNRRGRFLLYNTFNPKIHRYLTIN
jgi:hypothetical protein